MRAAISNAQARRIALGAQGFTAKRPTGRVDRRHLRKVIGHMGVIQIDSVNVLVRSQELPLFARLGAHPRTLIDDATKEGELFEFWVHEASHVPVELHPHLRWRMDLSHMWKSLGEFQRSRPAFVEEVHARVRDDGPLVAGDLKERVGKKGAWWDWDDGKVALEVLFASGRIAAVRRPKDFARVYDLAERVIPSDVLNLPTPSEADQRKELLTRAAAHHGVATLEDLTDYFRQRNPPCRPLVQELVEEGRLIETTVEGWDRPAYLHPNATRPRRINARALLSPFDPVVWNRERTERLFGFRYRIEIYVPEAKRRHGYYVLPFLLGGELVARVDLKADRASQQLLVQGAHGEPGIDEAAVAGALAEELRLLASWLDLDAGIVVNDRGDLAPAVGQAVSSATAGGT